MVEFSLDTGRTHQIRVHSSYKHSPLIGDLIYGNRRMISKKYDNKTKKFLYNFKRQALHSYKLEFLQPITDTVLKFQIPMPEDMVELSRILDKI